jgi:hypothetical protein
MREPPLIDTLEVPLVLSPSLTLASQLARKGRWAIVSLVRRHLQGWRCSSDLRAG